MEYITTKSNHAKPAIDNLKISVSSTNFISTTDASVEPDLTSILHKQFKRLGRERNKITYKLLSLLPKVAELEIYKKYNYSNIYEYAGKLAGLSHSVVEKTLAAHKNLRDKPHLQKAVESEGVHKVALVAKLATPETDRAWADTVKNMSKHSLSELAKEVRISEKIKVKSPKLVKSTGSDDGIPCNAAPTTIKIELDVEMQFLFLKLKKKFGNQLSNKEVMRQILKEANSQVGQSKTNTKPKETPLSIQNHSELKNSTSTKFPRGWNLKEDKEGVKQRVEQDSLDRQGKHDKIVKTTRYIPAQRKREALRRSDGKCAYPSCSHPPDVFHHPKRFSETKSHQSITPLCKAHHEFAHSGLIRNEKMTPDKWRLKVEVGVHSYADAHFRGIRRSE